MSNSKKNSLIRDTEGTIRKDIRRMYTISVNTKYLEIVDSFDKSQRMNFFNTVLNFIIEDNISKCRTFELVNHSELNKIEFTDINIVVKDNTLEELGKFYNYSITDDELISIVIESYRRSIILSDAEKTDANAKDNKSLSNTT